MLILADFAKLAGIIVILIAMDAQARAASPSPVIPPMLVVSWWFRVRVRDAYRAMRTAVAKLNAALQEVVSGMRIVQLFRRERLVASRIRRSRRRATGARRCPSVLYESAFSAVAELMGSVTMAAIVWAGGRRLAGGAITFGTLVAFIEYAGRFFRPVQELSQRYTVMQAAMASAERIFALLDTQATLVSPKEPFRPPGRSSRGDRVRERHLRLRRRKRGPAQRLVPRAARRAARRRGVDRGRQVHADPASRTPLRRPAGAHPAGRHRRQEYDLGALRRNDRSGAPGPLPVLGYRRPRTSGSAIRGSRP